MSATSTKYQRLATTTISRPKKNSSHRSFRLTKRPAFQNNIRNIVGGDVDGGFGWGGRVAGCSDVRSILVSAKTCFKFPRRARAIDGVSRLQIFNVPYCHIQTISSCLALARVARLARVAQLQFSSNDRISTSTGKPGRCCTRCKQYVLRHCSIVYRSIARTIAVFPARPSNASESFIRLVIAKGESGSASRTLRGGMVSCS